VFWWRRGKNQDPGEGSGWMPFGFMERDDFTKNKQISLWVQSNPNLRDCLGFVEAASRGTHYISRSKSPLCPNLEWIEQTLGGCGDSPRWWKGTTSGDCRSFV
jgi:hypothetical protein